MAKSAFARSFGFITLVSLTLVAGVANAAPPSASEIINGLSVQQHEARITALEQSCGGKLDDKSKADKCRDGIDNEKRRIGYCPSCKLTKELQAQVDALYGRVLELEKGFATQYDTEFAINVKAIKDLPADTQAILAPALVDMGKKGTLDQTATVQEMVRGANGAAQNGGPAYGLVKTPRVTVVTPSWKPDSTPAPQAYFAPQALTATKKSESSVHGWGYYTGYTLLGAGAGAGLAAAIVCPLVDAESFDAETNTLDTTGKDIIVGTILGGAGLGALLGGLLAWHYDGVDDEDTTTVRLTNLGVAPLGDDGAMATIGGNF